MPEPRENIKNVKSGLPDCECVGIHERSPKCVQKGFLWHYLCVGKVVLSAQSFKPPLNSIRMDRGPPTLCWTFYLLWEYFPYCNLNVCSFVLFQYCVIWHLAKPVAISVPLGRSWGKQIALCWLEKTTGLGRPLPIAEVNLALSLLQVKPCSVQVLDCFMCDSNFKMQLTEVFRMLFLVVGTMMTFFYLPYSWSLSLGLVTQA